MKSSRKIQDHAIIGDGRSAALVTRDGTVDWLCWPRFNSPAIFGSLLDEHVGGCWSIRATAPCDARQGYLNQTNVLETRFETEDGTTVLTDFMLAASEEQKQRMLIPEHELIRRVHCERGECNLQIQFAPRCDYGRHCLVFRDSGPLGLRARRGAMLVTLRSDVKLRPITDGWMSEVVLRAGQHIDLSLSYSQEGPAIVPPLGRLIDQKLEITAAWWRDWAGLAQYHGPYREEVIRSALALKLMLFAPSGAIVAAATTSLPEQIGGDRNWDYRYCWLRDAAFTTRALLGLGYREEGEAFVSWLLHATRLTRPELRVVYDVYGNRVPREKELSHLDGYLDSLPVRIGNAAKDQLQLDVYGEVVDAVSQSLKPGKAPDRETQRMLRQFGDYVCQHWSEPDNGIWETREGREHFMHSRLMCWVALDRLLRMHESGQLTGIRVKHIEHLRDVIRGEIEERAWNSELESYTQTLDANDLDATALLPAFYGFHAADSWRMRRTFERLQERLSPVPGLMYRNEQDRKEGQGTFAMCGFWAAEFLARGGGTLRESCEAFEQNLRYANDVGLFAEEIEPETRDALGNFPQTFTHIGLINAALSILEREKNESQPRRQNKATCSRRTRMNVSSWLLWGFVSTIVLTTILAGSQGVGMTRINIPYLLGTIVTPNRNRAKIVGIVMHLVNGWLFSLLYIAAFHSIGVANWWFGALIGAIHASFVLAVAMPSLPGMHPRMANEQYGPTIVRQLEPPGFLAMNYGFQTPTSILIAHMVFGAILGAFYTFM